MDEKTRRIGIFLQRGVSVSVRNHNFPIPNLSFIRNVIPPESRFITRLSNLFPMDVLADENYDGFENALIEELNPLKGIGFGLVTVPVGLQLLLEIQGNGNEGDGGVHNVGGAGVDNGGYNVGGDNNVINGGRNDNLNDLENGNGAILNWLKGFLKGILDVGKLICHQVENFLPLWLALILFGFSWLLALPDSAYVGAGWKLFKAFFGWKLLKAAVRFGWQMLKSKFWSTSVKVYHQIHLAAAAFGLNLPPAPTASPNLLGRLLNFRNCIAEFSSSTVGFLPNNVTGRLDPTLVCFVIRLVIYYGMLSVPCYVVFRLLNRP